MDASVNDPGTLWTPSALSRRRLLHGLVSAAALAALGPGRVAWAGEAQRQKEGAPLKGRIKQSVSKWCFGKIPWDEFCPAILAMGIKGVDLVGPGDFATLKKYGLVATMVNVGGGMGIGKGFNRKENHEMCVAGLRKAIEAAAESSYPNVICFSGNRAGMDDATGAANCVEGLKQIAPFAEEKKVTVCLELLNSKVNHKDYMADNTAWAVDVCKKVGSPRVKLLYDIYHQAIMGDDVIPVIRKNIEYFGHFHTGGVPGRNEIDSTQTLDYPAIMRAIVETKYDGWVAHEFIPKSKEPLKSLAEAVKICDV
ncbi:MAG: sugar phosphate isomerase/epimerase [Planctomycetes bacterium]|nr:sugar phosphate isomerase/epimerase [Planctomycetota bacterium]